MKSFFSYWFWPNPAGWHYADSRVQMLLGICLLLVVLSFVIRVWRNAVRNPVTRTLSKSWSRAAFWIGVVGLIFAVSRVETIQFLSMRILWLLLGLFAVLYALLQLLRFRARHYSFLDRVRIVDEREKYLPKRKR